MACLTRSALVLAFIQALSGCGGNSSTPSVRLALDGPPLVLVVQSDSAIWKGTMERGCLAGFGHITMQKADGSTICSGGIDHPATEKGRMYANISCDDGTSIVLIYRNLGPDQGMGLARTGGKEADEGEDPDGGEQAVLFYHPSAEEAERRLVQVREDITRAAELIREKEEDIE